MKQVALIGTGPSGIGTLFGIHSEISKTASSLPRNHLKICVFEKSQFIGQGTPYNFDKVEPEHLVNMPFESMSITPGDLKQWLQENDSRVRNIIKEALDSRFKEKFFKRFGITYDHTLIENYIDDFGSEFTAMKNHSDNYTRTFESRYLDFSRDEVYLPRMIFGQYLQDRFHSVVSDLISYGVDIEIRANTEVKEVLEDEGQKLIIKSTSSDIDSESLFDEVIIATGHWQDSKFQKHNAHLDSVWPSQNFKTKLNQLILEKYSHESDSGSEPETFRILVHGTSLSAIDAIKSMIFDEGFIDLQADGSLNCVKPEYTVRREDGSKVKVGLSIDLVSRNGFLSKVRGKYGDYQNQYWHN